MTSPGDKIQFLTRGWGRAPGHLQEQLCTTRWHWGLRTGVLRALQPSVEKLIPAMAMELDNYSPWCEDPRMFVLCFFKNTSGHSKRFDFLFYAF